jgi:hypothetical protein
MTVLMLWLLPVASVFAGAAQSQQAGGIDGGRLLLLLLLLLLLPLFFPEEEEYREAEAREVEKEYGRFT